MLLASALIHMSVLAMLGVTRKPERVIPIGLISLSPGGPRGGDAIQKESSEKRRGGLQPPVSKAKRNEIVLPLKKPKLKPPIEKAPVTERPVESFPALESGPEEQPASLETASAKGFSVEGDIEGSGPHAGYLGLLRDKVSRNWKPLAWTGGRAARTTLYFRLKRDGQISNLVVRELSGMPLVDQSALRAIINSVPFAPLPAEFSEDELGVYFRFVLIGEP